MEELLPLIKKLEAYINHLAKSAEEKRQATYTIREIYLQDPEMELRCQDLINRASYLNGEVHGLYDMLDELNYILALAEKAQEEKDTEK